MTNRDVQLYGIAWLHPEIPFCTQTGLSVLLKRTDNTNVNVFFLRSTTAFTSKPDNFQTIFFHLKMLAFSRVGWSRKSWQVSTDKDLAGFSVTMKVNLALSSGKSDLKRTAFISFAVKISRSDNSDRAFS